MMDNHESFEGWAILELMERRRLIGYISEVTFAGTPFVRIDVLMGEGRTTQYYNGQSIYAVTPVSEATARRAASLNVVAPISQWELPAPRVPEAVAAAATGYVQSDDDHAADVADFLDRYTNGVLVLDSDVLDRLDAAIEQAALVRVIDDTDDTGDLDDSSDPYNADAGRDRYAEE